MVEDAVCTACGALVTNKELAREGVIGVLGRAGRMQFHLRCFDWSEEERRVNRTSAERQGAVSGHGLS